MKRPARTVLTGRAITYPMRDTLFYITRLLKSRQDKKVTPTQGGLNKLLRRFHEEIKITHNRASIKSRDVRYSRY